MSYPQLPYETVQESNTELQKLCDFGNENPELLDLIHQLLKIYSCDYDPYDSNNKLNKLIDKYMKISVAYLCQLYPDKCKLLKLTFKEMCKLSKLSATDFRKALCQYKLKTTCLPGNKNCNVAEHKNDIATKFCNECQTTTDYRPMFNTYFDFEYDQDYDEWFKYACQQCPH